MRTSDIQFSVKRKLFKERSQLSTLREARILVGSVDLDYLLKGTLLINYRSWSVLSRYIFTIDLGMNNVVLSDGHSEGLLLIGKLEHKVKCVMR